MNFFSAAFTAVLFCLAGVLGYAQEIQSAKSRSTLLEWVALTREFSTDCDPSEFARIKSKCALLEARDKSVVTILETTEKRKLSRSVALKALVEAGKWVDDNWSETEKLVTLVAKHAGARSEDYRKLTTALLGEFDKQRAWMKRLESEMKQTES